MKKILILSTIVSTMLLGSDPVTMDSMFENQQGLRSITTLQSISSGSSASYRTYPDLIVVNDGKMWSDVKSVSLNQTFLYDFTSNFDGIISATANTKRKEYFDFTTGYGSQDTNEFDSLWVGGTYSLDTVGAFKPSITFQTAIHQKDRYLENSKNSSLASHSLKTALRNYSDPVISTIYIGTTINNTKNIGGYEVEDGNALMLGFDMSVILSPKISLDLGIEQRYQTENKVDNEKYSNATNISTMTIGATYSLTPKMSLSVSGSLGGSSQSPDSMMAVSLWQKF